ALDGTAALVPAPVLCLAGPRANRHGPVARRLVRRLQPGHPPAGHRRHGRDDPGDDFPGQPRPYRPPPATAGGSEPGLHSAQPGGTPAGMVEHSAPANRLLVGQPVRGSSLRSVRLVLRADSAGATAGWGAGLTPTLPPLSSFVPAPLSLLLSPVHQDHGRRGERPAAQPFRAISAKSRPSCCHLEVYHCFWTAPIESGKLFAH